MFPMFFEFTKSEKHCRKNIFKKRNVVWGIGEEAEPGVERGNKKRIREARENWENIGKERWDG